MTDATKNLHFTKTHEWLTIENGDATIGVTQHAQELLGDMVFVELPNVGHEVRAGEELGVLESVKAAADFYSPITGVVVAVNQHVAQNPALVNSDPFGEGWLVKLKVEKPALIPEELSTLLNQEEYQHEIKDN